MTNDGAQGPELLGYLENRPADVDHIGVAAFGIAVRGRIEGNDPIAVRKQWLDEETEMAGPAVPAMNQQDCRLLFAPDPGRQSTSGTQNLKAPCSGQ